MKNNTYVTCICINNSYISSYMSIKKNLMRDTEFLN